MKHFTLVALILMVLGFAGCCSSKSKATQENQTIDFKPEKPVVYPMSLKQLEILRLERKIKNLVDEIEQLEAQKQKTIEKKQSLQEKK